MITKLEGDEALAAIRLIGQSISNGQQFLMLTFPPAGAAGAFSAHSNCKDVDVLLAAVRAFASGLKKGTGQGEVRH